MNWLPILWVVVGVVLLLVLNMKFKLNSFVALFLVAILVGILNGIPLTEVMTIVKAGFGGTLGSLALIIGFGAILGKLMVDSGAAQRIATTLIAKFGIKYIEWALIIIGAVFGIAVFYEVAFIIIAPLVITIAVEAKVPFLRLAMTAIAAPLMDTMDVNPVLLVLATAAGSNTITHVNDASFWLFKEYFGLSIKDTFKTWGALQMVNSLVGISVVLILDIFI